MKRGDTWTNTGRVARPRGLKPAALTCLALAAPTLAGIAQELGPAPVGDAYNAYTGRVSAVACSRTDPNRYYIAGADGGVWRTTDGGTTWTPLTDKMPTLSIGALALDPTNESTIYVGTGEANYANHSRYGLGLYKSTDGGNTWVQLGESTFGGRTFSRIIVHPQNPQRIYAALARAGGFPALAAAKGHPARDGPVGVFRSDDAGVTWTQLAGGLPNQAATDLALAPTNPSTLYAGIGHPFGALENGIYKSTDGGDTWTQLRGGLPWTPSYNITGRISVAVAPSDPNRLYALLARRCDAAGGGASTQGAYRSLNGGATWTPVGLPSIQATYGWYLSFVTVRPTDPNVAFMAGLSLCRATDGFSFNDVTPPHVDLHGVDWDAAGRLVVGDDGGVHRTDDLGNTWTSLNDGLGVIQFYAGLSTHPTDDSFLLGGMQDNGSGYRLPGSPVWTQVFDGDGGWTQLDQTNPLRFFVEYQGSGTVYRSQDGGASVNFCGSGINTSDRNCFEAPYLIDPTNSSRMLYATHRLYRSTDGGTGWSALSGDLTAGGSAAIRSVAFAPSDPNIVYVATNDGRILRSGDGGANFALIASGVSGWPRTTRELFVHPTDPNTVYLAVGYFGVPKIRRTTDGGQTWTALDANFPDVPVNTVAVDVRPRRPVIYAGADNGLYRSVDGGGTWHRYGAGLPNAAVVDLRLELARSRLVIGTQGRGAWTVPFGIPGDCNCDGVANAADIDAFVAALGQRPPPWTPAYGQARSGAPAPCAILNADVNGDGQVTFTDIDPFVDVLAH